MATEFGSNLPPELVRFNQEVSGTIIDLQDLARIIPRLSINLPFMQFPDRIQQLLVLAGIESGSNPQVGYHYQGDPDEIYVSFHGQYHRSYFRLNWFPSHPNAISGIKLHPQLRSLGDYINISPHFQLLEISAELSAPIEDARKRHEYLQTRLTDPVLGTYHLALLKDLTLFTKNCADILSGNILKPES